jgi:hypothetical protein
MGSLGQYKGEVSNVHDVHIENVWMMNGDVSKPSKILCLFSLPDIVFSTLAPASKSGQAKKLVPDMSTMSLSSDSAPWSTLHPSVPR